MKRGTLLALSRFPRAILFEWVCPRLNFHLIRETPGNSLESSIVQKSGSCGRNLRILFFLPLCFPLAAVSQTLDWVQEMKEGERAFEAKNYAVAESHFVSAGKSAENDTSHPENRVVSFYGLTQVYCSENKTAEAGRALERAFEAHRKLMVEPDSRARLVAAFTSIGVTQAAEMLAKTGTTIGPVLPETFSCIRSIAQAGNPTAQSFLGTAYAQGLAGQTKNAVEAAGWFRKAAEQGYAFAENALGRLYREGEGVPKDAAEALKWFRQSADQGDPAGEASLGWMYDNGLGVKQDYAEAFKWYRAAAEQGDANGRTNLAWLYQNGLGVKQDKD